MALMEVKWKVEIIESERGWGQKLEEVKEFDSEKEAQAFIKKFNARNTAKTTPDYYVYAREAGAKISFPGTSKPKEKKDGK